MEPAIKAIEYKIQQLVAHYLRLKEMYEGLTEKIKKLKNEIDSFEFCSNSLTEIMYKIDYIKINLYEIQQLEDQSNQILKDMESLKEEIKFLNARKKALRKFFEKKAKNEQKKEILREIEVAQEVYRSKLTNNQ